MSFRDHPCHSETAHVIPRPHMSFRDRTCHSERSEESLVLGFRFFTPLHYVQNDMVRATLRSQ